jgi:outer membrane protein OmpA-like peptidoglycan-associated protein
MVKYYVLFLFVLKIVASFAQQEIDPACLPPEKKVLKVLTTAKNSTDSKVAAENFAKAIELAPELAAVYFEFGMYSYEKGVKAYESNPNPAVGDRNFAKAEELLEKASELCPDYHSDMYYTLGVINYTQEHKETAKEWFEKFIAFKHTEPEHYGADFSKQKAEVNQLLKMESEAIDFTAQEVPFEPVVVKNVSTALADEYFPMLSPDNLLLFYTRKGEKNELDGFQATTKPKEVYTFSKRSDEMSLFSSGTPFKAPFNTGKFESYGAATMSVDNKEMIICACQKTTVGTQPYLNCDLYSTTFNKIGTEGNDYQWTELVNLGSKINTPNGWEGQPSLSADGQTLFYTANRPTTKDNDVFIVKRNPDGSWGAPTPFAPINTDGKDKSPFLHQDSETLYFVSSSTDKRKGVGGLDIFYMRQDGEKWTEPKNIGFPINSVNDEIGLFVSMDGKTAYFSSQTEGNWNIFSFDLYEEARPKPVTIIKGDLTDANGSPIENATIEVAYANSDKVEQVKVNGNDGKYAVIVKQEKPQDIIVSVKKEGAAFQSKLITQEELKAPEKRNNNELIVKELKVGEAYTINDILYDYNSAELSEKSRFILREFARYLKANPTIKIAIQGHTDSDGNDALNLDLSDRRAKGVENYLIQLGVAAERLDAKGFGETQPKVDNDTPENKAINRRTDFVIKGL